MWPLAAAVGTGALGATLAAADTPDPTNSLTQYGIAGVVVMGAGVVIRLLLNRINDAHEAERLAWREERAQLIADKATERARADRAEGNLANLNQLVQAQALPAQAEAQRLVAEAIAMVRSTQR